jgi:chromate transport protein ChrA
MYVEEAGTRDCVQIIGKFQYFSRLYDHTKTLSLDIKSISISIIPITVMKLLYHKPSNAFLVQVWLNGLRDTDLCFTHIMSLVSFLVCWLVGWLVGWLVEKKKPELHKGRRDISIHLYWS